MLYVFSLGYESHINKLDKYLLVGNNNAEVLNGGALCEYLNSISIQELPDKINIHLDNLGDYIISSYFRNIFLEVSNKFLFICKSNVGAYAWYKGEGIIADGRYFYTLGISPLELFNAHIIRHYKNCSYAEFKRIACMGVL